MKKVAFEFVVEALERLNPRINPMFGCHAIYVGEKIVLILRKREDHDDDNGVWVATLPEHVEGLRKVFPSMRSIRLLGSKITTWQNLPFESDDFEESAMRACAMILKGDPRIGKVPKQKTKKIVKKK